MNCKYCGKETKTEYCSIKCYNVQRTKLAEENRQKNLDALNNEGVDHIVCKWCGMKVKRVYGIHMKNHHPNKTSHDYKIEFPGSPLTCAEDKYATSKNAGLHMKEDKYRQMVSDKVKGTGNPNHRSRTTDEQRKERSPFSKSFYESRGIDSNDSENKVKEFVKEALKDRITESQFEYWLEKADGNISKAKELYKIRQQTFTLEKCVTKYGNELGFEVWRDRNVKWSAKVEEKYKNGEFTKFCKHNYSNKELQFFSELLNMCDIKKYYCALNGKSQFFRYFKELQKTFSYDFVAGKKIIEFNGDYWHCNPKKYDPLFFHNVLGCTAQEKWEGDKIKIDAIKKCGYDVFIIWEDEYKTNPEETIKKCIEFLNESNT